MRAGHAIGLRDARRKSINWQLDVIEAIRSALADEMAADERVLVLGEDVARRAGCF